MIRCHIKIRQWFVNLRLALGTRESLSVLFRAELDSRLLTSCIPDASDFQEQATIRQLQKHRGSDMTGFRLRSRNRLVSTWRRFRYGDGELQMYKCPEGKVISKLKLCFCTVFLREPCLCWHITVYPGVWLTSADEWNSVKPSAGLLQPRAREQFLWNVCHVGVWSKIVCQPITR